MQSLNMDDTLDNYYNIFKNDIYKINSNNYNNEINLAFNNYYFKIKFELGGYKNIEYFKHLDLLSKYLTVLSNENVINLLVYINQCMFGQKILLKIKDYINKLPNDIILNLCNFSCFKWTFPIYMFYLDILKKKDLNEIEETLNNIITLAFSNTDDRIYKDVVKNTFLLKIFYKNKTDLINKIIMNIMDKHIPGNYILRRFKYFNTIVPDLYKYFHFIIINIKLDFSYILPTLMKYYYKNYKLSSHEITIIAHYLPFNKSLFETIYSLLLTDEEKYKFIIETYSNKGTTYGYSIMNGEKYFNVLKDTLKSLFDVIYIQSLTHDINKNEFGKIINSFNIVDISSIICFDKLIENNKYRVLLLFLP